MMTVYGALICFPAASVTAATLTFCLGFVGILPGIVCSDQNYAATLSALTLNVPVNFTSKPAGLFSDTNTTTLQSADDRRHILVDRRTGPKIEVSVTGDKNGFHWHDLCGNGFVDADEDCDCGSLANCSVLAQQCCDAKTCMFTKGAQCATGGCCTMDCKFKTDGQVCRPVKNSCDVPEVCSGSSSVCPPDAFKRNGDDCVAGGEGYCFSRKCMTHSEQCIEVWGLHSNLAKSECYQQFNIRGVFNGHCGIAADNITFKKCAEHDAMCGTLQCRGGGYGPLIVQNAVPVFSTTVLTNASGILIQCKTVSPEVSSFVNVESLLVRDGTKCGPNMMCLKGHCVRREFLVPAGTCPSKNSSEICSNHGSCTDINSCYCTSPYSGADCSVINNSTKKNNKPPVLYDMLKLRRGVQTKDKYKKTINEIVDNDALQVVVIIMSVFLLGGTIAIMSLTCCSSARSGNAAQTDRRFRTAEAGNEDATTLV